MYNDQEQMIDDQILCDFLDNAVFKAKERIRLEGRIETEDAIPLMLKSQFNHIAHLETKMVTKDEFNARFGEINTRFGEINTRFGNLTAEFNTRFGEINTRFGSLTAEFNTRFSSLEKELGFIKWLIAAGFALLACMPFFSSLIK